MAKPLKQILISVLFFGVLSSSFYLLLALFFKEIEFLNSLTLFLISLLFSAVFFILLVLTFSCTPSEEVQESKNKEKKQEEKQFQEDKQKEDAREQENKLEKEIDKKEIEGDNLKPSKFKSSFIWSIPIYFLAAGLFFLLFHLSSLISPESTIYFAIGTFLFFIFLCLGARAIKSEKDILLKFKFFRISQKGLGIFFTGIAVLIAILFFFSPKIIGGELTLPPSLFDVLWKGVGTPQDSFFLPGIGLYFGFSEDVTVDEYLLLQASEILSKFEEQNQPKTSISLPFEKDPIEVEMGMSKEEFEKEILKEGRKRFSIMIGKEVKGNENIKGLFYEMASGQVSKVIEPYKKAGEIGLIFIFFLLTRMVLMLFSYICLPFAFLVFKLFKATKFFEMKKTKVDKEVLTI